MEIMVLNYLNLHNNFENLNEGPACAEIARLDFHLDLEKIKQNKQKNMVHHLYFIYEMACNKS